MRTCCWIYNRALEQRTKAYKRRKDSISLYDQCALLTEWRSRMNLVQKAPAQFARDALRRIDIAFQSFFRRCKSGEKPGYPRFKSFRRYNSLEIIAGSNYLKDSKCQIPKLGLVKFRAGNQEIPPTQKLLRIIKRSNGWYGQVVVESEPKALLLTGQKVGIDVGLNTFAALSDGTKIANPRWARRSERKLRIAQRYLSRCKDKSRNRRKAVQRVQRVYAKVTAQRKNFCHQESRKIVNRFDLIAVEKLNIKGLVRTRMSKSILDAGWGIFLNQLTYKAENAGKHIIEVDPSGTSQECPRCGQVKRKELSERIHSCTHCGLVLDRDVAASKVILSRAVESNRSVTPSEGLASTCGSRRRRAVSKTKAVLISN